MQILRKQHLWRIWKWNLCACVFMDSVASDPPVGLNLWTPHANPLMQQLLNYFAEQLPPENGGLSLVLFRKNKVILEKKVNDKWHVFLCHLNIKGAQSSRYYQIPSAVHVQNWCREKACSSIYIMINKSINKPSIMWLFCVCCCERECNVHKRGKVRRRPDWPLLNQAEWVSTAGC